MVLSRRRVADIGRPSEDSAGDINATNERWTISVLDHLRLCYRDRWLWFS